MSKARVNYRRADAFEKRDAPWYHPIEAAPADEISALQDRKLVEQMAYIEANSTFYQQKFAAEGIRFADIRTVSDLPKVPFTLKQELRESLEAEPPFGQHRAAPLEEIIQMQASSGTTGSPSYIALTQSDAESWQEMSARGLYACGVRPGDFVLHGFSMSKGFVGGLPCFQALQYMGAIDAPIGADGGIDRLLVVARDIRPRCVLGAPNFILHLGERAPDLIGMKASELGVERIVVGGEPGGGIPAIRQAIQEIWGAKVCELLGGTDLGVIYWAECEEQDGMHMQCMDHIIVELLDPKTETVIPFEDGISGELVYTAIGRRASPVVRFRSGDHVVVTGTSCKCGRTGPKIRCVGRTDDMLIVRGVNVFPSAIQDIVLRLRPQTNGVVRVLADFEGHTTQGNLKVLVERGRGRDPSGDGDLKTTVEDRLRNALSFKAEAAILPADTFEKPGTQKLALTLREPPKGLKI